jgi:hypothetical protein
VQLATVTLTLLAPDEKAAAPERQREHESAQFRFNGLLDYTVKLIEKELPNGYRVEVRAE